MAPTGTDIEPGAARGAPARSRGPALGRRRRRRPDMLTIGGRIGLWPFVGIAATVFAALLLLWAVATANEWVKPIFLPGPLDVWDRLVELARGGELSDDVRISVFRIAVGFSLATVMALPIGLLIGAYRFWEAAIEP